MTTQLISIGVVAKTLGVTVQTVRNWHRDGKFTPYKILASGHRRYSRDAVIELLYEREPWRLRKSVVWTKKVKPLDFAAMAAKKSIRG